MSQLVPGLQIMVLGMGVVFLTLYALSLLLKVMETVVTGEASGEIRLLRALGSSLFPGGKKRSVKTRSSQPETRDLAVIVAVINSIYNGREYRIVSIRETD